MVSDGQNSGANAQRRLPKRPCHRTQRQPRQRCCVVRQRGVEPTRTGVHDKQITGGHADAMLAREFSQCAAYCAVDLAVRPLKACCVGPLVRVARVKRWLHQASQLST